MAPLTGKELINKTKDLIKEGTNLSMCAKLCGYSSSGPKDTTIPQVSSYLKELVSSFGVTFPVGKRGGRGRASTNSVNVMGNYSVLLSAKKIEGAELSPGDDIKIEFDSKSRSFILTKVEVPVVKTPVSPVASPQIMQVIPVVPTEVEKKEKEESEKKDEFDW